MRHAKSSWDQPDLQDFDRPLNQRGKQDAPKMGRFLSKVKVVPDQIFSSPAARAKATVLAVTNEMGLPEQVINWKSDLYYGGPEDYVKAIRDSKENSEIVMTVGHNPMSEEFIDMLAGEIVTTKIATATIACFETDAENWNEVGPENCRVLWIKSPKNLED